jgi:hypothetical protein
MKRRGIIMALIDTMQEYILLIRSGYYLEDGHWTLGERHFASRQSAVSHLRDLALQDAIRRCLQK